MNRSVTAAAWSGTFFTERFVAAEIRSAGTHAYDGNRAAASTIEAMSEHGFDLRSHRTSPLTPAALAWADTIVVMEPMHKDTVVGLAPQHAAKILPMWPFVGDGEGTWVHDPHGGPIEGYRAMALEIGEASKKLVAHVLAERRKNRTRS